jgi:hypothetical protein
MQTARYFHASTLLANGKVLVTGGSTNGSATASAELFDPASGSLAYIWRSAGSMSTPRLGHSATLLRDGRVLVTGGHSGGFTPTNADIYDPGPGFSPNWRPQIADASSTVTFGGSLSVTGSQFRGMSQASSGGRLTSDTDYPLLQLRSLNSARTAFLSVSNWSTNFFSSLSITGFPAGPALATIFVNGIPSTSAMVQVIAPMPTVPFLTDLKSLSNGSFRFGFTNTPGTIFGVLATTNVALPMSNWTVAGSASEIAPGQFQFTDVQAASPGHREYRVRLP